MTNYEKNKELLDMYAIADITWCVNNEGKVSECHGNCGDCIFGLDELCARRRLAWLQQEYKEPEVDWSKVEIDTPVLVRNFPQDLWIERYFAGYIGGKVCAFDNRHTSKDFNMINHWKYAKLAEEENKDDRVDAFGTDIALMCEDVLNVLDNCIEIPNNATNGDVIKAIFNIPDSEIDEGLSTTYIYTKTRVLKGGSQDHLKEQITFNRKWWNAPYKKGDASK